MERDRKAQRPIVYRESRCPPGMSKRQHVECFRAHRGGVRSPGLKPYSAVGEKNQASMGASMVALFLAAMLQWAALLAVCPTLHELIHHDADDEHHDCAVTLFLAGQIEQAFNEPIAIGQSTPVGLLLDRTYSRVVYGSFFLSRCILEHAPPLVR